MTVSSSPVTIQLVQQADPYELDGPTSWLSDRFAGFPDEHRRVAAGPVHRDLKNTGNPQTDAPEFIKAVIDGFNGDPAAAAESSVRPDLDRRTGLGGHPESVDFRHHTPVYNFAMARVRYQSDCAVGAWCEYFSGSFGLPPPRPHTARIPMAPCPIPQ